MNAQSTINAQATINDHAAPDGGAVFTPDAFTPDAFTPDAFTSDAAAPAPVLAPTSPPVAGMFNYQGDHISDAFAAFPELQPAWAYKTSECGHGGVHRLSVLDPFEDGERTLTDWVVRVSPKTGQVWVRHLTAAGGKLGYDRVYDTLLLAKTSVEAKVAGEFGPSAEVIRSISPTADAATDAGAAS